MTSLHQFSLFIGRFHPLIIHLPIALILLVVFFECLGQLARFSSLNIANRIIISMLMPLTLLAVLCGWLLSLGGGYNLKLLNLHKWAGFILGSMTLLTCGFYFLGSSKRVFHVFLGVTAILMGFVSHLGGSLTHGADYLTHYMPIKFKILLGPPMAAAENLPLISVSDEKLYSKSIYPILQKYCLSCHGPEKSKGNLRLDRASSLQGESKIAQDLIERLDLPVNDDIHMPPEDEKQMSAEEKLMLRGWYASFVKAD